jgi:hypothetical protein
VEETGGRNVGRRTPLDAAADEGRRFGVGYGIDQATREWSVQCRGGGVIPTVTAAAGH